MAKYRKKPVVIEAFRFGHDDWPEWFPVPIRLIGQFQEAARFLGSDGRRVVVWPHPNLGFKYGNVELQISAREEVEAARVSGGAKSVRGHRGDWIIRSAEDKLYVCKDHIFRTTYEEIDDER